MDYHRLSKVATPIAAVFPNMVSMLEQMDTFSGTWYPSCKCPFFSISLSEDPRNSLHSTVKASNTLFIILCQGYICTPALCHDLVLRDLDFLSFPQDTTLAHYTDDIMLLELDKQEEATVPGIMVRHLHVRGWKITQQRSRDLPPQ